MTEDQNMPQNAEPGCELADEIDALADALRKFPANGKPEAGYTTNALILTNLIERKEVHKPCRSCGTPKLD